MLVLGEKASWMLFFMNILINPIISKINIFMMSHLGTLSDTLHNLSWEKSGVEGLLKT